MKREIEKTGRKFKRRKESEDRTEEDIGRKRTITKYF